MVVVTIILVLSSVGVFLYQRAIAHAEDTVCRTNLKALNKAVILYLEENDSLPASLGQLRLKHLDRGYAKAMSERNRHEKLCFFILKLHGSGGAHAQFLTYETLQKYGAARQAFQCPANAHGAVSYGINADVVGKRAYEISDETILIADCDSHVFTSADQIRRRHAAGKAFAVRKSGQIAEIDEKNASLILGPADLQPAPSSDDPYQRTPSKTSDVRPTPANTANDDFPSDLYSSVKYFDDLVKSHFNTPIADKAEDLRDKLQAAVKELSKSPPDYGAAKGNIKGAEGDLNAMIKDGLIDPAKGSALKKVLRDLAKSY